MRLFWVNCETPVRNVRRPFIIHELVTRQQTTIQERLQMANMMIKVYRGEQAGLFLGGPSGGLSIT